MLIFYNDLVECKKAVQLLAMKRGAAVGGTLLPIQKTKGRRMADMNTVRYCGRYDIFMDRMQTYLTDELIETVKFYTELV